MKKILIFLLLFIPINAKAYDSAVVDINNLSIKEIQEYVDKGYLTYEKITKLYLDRIDAYNKQYNALITVNDKALEQAKKLDEEFKKNGRKSLIYGLPVIVKDNIDVIGMPTTNGTKALLDSFPYTNADVIQKLIDNGAIIIAKANMDEFAFNAGYSYSSFGYVRNAHDTDYSSYGSSGGSAVGVAANLDVYALGTDTGVSVRVPSSANGVIGMRPSTSIINTDGVIKFEETRDTVGVITKYVEDNAIVLDIIDNSDTTYTLSIENKDKPLEGISIGVIKPFMSTTTSSTSVTYNKADKFVVDLVNNEIEILKNLGAKIIYLDSFSLTYKFDATTMCSEFNKYIQNTSSKIKSLSDLIKNGNYTQYIDSYNNYYCNHDYKNTNTYKNYIENRNSNIKKANNIFKNNNVDAVIYPTLKRKLATIKNAKSVQISTPSSSTAPLIGFPALSLPMGFNDNLPYGLEIMAQEKNEGLIYKIASSLENENKVYKTPDIAPSLYEISDNLNLLLDYYENYKNNEKYNEINKEVLEFITNYNGDDTNIDKLIYNYENYKEEIKENENNKYSLIIESGIILIVILIIIKGAKYAIKRFN